MIDVFSVPVLSDVFVIIGIIFDRRSNDLVICVTLGYIDVVNLFH